MLLRGPESIFDSLSVEILNTLLQAVSQQKDGVDPLQFRANYHEHFTEIKKLETDGYIYSENGKYLHH